MRMDELIEKCLEINHIKFFDVNDYIVTFVDENDEPDEDYPQIDKHQQIGRVNCYQFYIINKSQLKGVGLAKEAKGRRDCWCCWKRVDDGEYYKIEF